MRRKFFYTGTTIYNKLSTCLLCLLFIGHSISINANSHSLGKSAIRNYESSSPFIFMGNIPCNAMASEITGIVFEDFDYDGLFDTEEFQGVEGIPVTATDSLGNIFTDVTDKSGLYALPGLTSNRTYRIEFTFPDSVAWATPTFFEGDNGTTVQFITAGNCANLGVASPEDYCHTDDPEVTLACYDNGDGSANNNIGFVRYTYSDDGIPEIYDPGSGVANPISIATVAQVGSSYGVAYERTSEYIYTTALLKRHVSLGPLGLGGVYLIHPTTGYVGSFDLDGVVPANGGAALDFGSINRTSVPGPIANGVAGDYQLSQDHTEASVDLDAFAKIGKAGMGDTDLSEDGNTLWTINLNDTEIALLNIDLKDPSNPIPTNGSSPSGAIVNRYLLSSMNPPSCTNGVFRPFALAFENGKGYLGGVCSAENGGTETDLEAYILSFDPANPLGGLTTEISFPLDYTRELKSEFPHNEDSDWKPWEDDWTNLTINNNLFINFSTPILADIEFTGSGEMIIGFMDRFGHQAGFQEYAAVSGGSTGDFYDVETGGDMIHVCLDNGSWVLEGSASGSCNDSDNGTGFGTSLTNDGPNNIGEYYWEDHFRFSNRFGHHEILHGGLAVLKGSEEVISISFDPVQRADGGAPNTQGVITYNTSTGSRTKNYLIVDANGTYLGKSVALGDLTLICNPAPIEIGNYVWIDTNGDGVQDAGEPVADGVTMELYDNTGNLLATTTTDANGQYYFSADGTDNANWVNANDGLEYSSDYYIVAGGNGQFASGEITLNGTVHELTLTDNASGSNADFIDTDGIVATGIDPDFDGEPYVLITTGTAGHVNHSYDFGFTEPFEIYDWGDLPDPSAGTGPLNYETEDANNGPSHQIIPGLLIGSTVDDETNGQASADALGDGADEDGFNFPTTLSIVPGGILNLPIDIVNTTGTTAHYEVWIDWNGDGDFNDLGEMVADLSDDGAGNFGLTHFTVNIPTNATTNQLLGFRARLSNTDNMTPYGQVDSGEVEDYLIMVSCKTNICLPIQIVIN